MKIQEIIQYLKIVQKWWWIIILLFGTTIGTMLAIMLLTVTEYEATATLQVSAPPPQQVPLFSQFGREALREAIKQTQDGFSEFLTGGDTASLVRKAVPETSMKTRELRERITVEIPKDSQLMHISVRAFDAELAAKLANELVEIGLQQYGLLLAQPTANTRKFIDLELELAREELKAAEAELVQFQINNTVGDLKRAIIDQQELVSLLKRDVDRARVGGELDKTQALEEIILEREAELQDLIGLSAQYNDLADRVSRARNTHTFLLDKRSDAQIKENQIVELGSIQIITLALPPDRPVTVISPKLIFLGGGVSLVAGILLTFLLEYIEMSGVFRGLKRETRQTEMAVLSDNIG